jgi:hypothetical protein
MGEQGTDLLPRHPAGKHHEGLAQIDHLIDPAAEKSRRLSSSGNFQ